ncbi:hypothetical protein V6N11_027469 [Hibiscus sabdariffa]|uniref:Ankyrin repeat protein n=1 Tax=Hibiscus sabdariffa TaxID=183260 RepID=A0ABR2PH10_9ROSI
MTVMHGGSGGGYIIQKPVFPGNYWEEFSQRLIDALHGNDSKLSCERLADPFVDVNFVGTVNLKSKMTEISLHDEAAHEVLVNCEEFKTEVTPLFLAAHVGNMFLVKKLLSLGANLNHKLFRGYATTAAVREGHMEILEAALRTLVAACCRGFVDFVDMLIKCGVDADAANRVLLRSSKPSLHVNIDCNALSAAVVCRQTSVVRSLLLAGIKTAVKVRVGAWSWDIDTGEEIRVGAGLADAYSVIWCAVEYFEVSGSILCSLLQSASELRCRLGCDIDSQTAFGDSALMSCARYKCGECLNVLASAGADFGLLNSSGQSASAIAGLTKWNHGFQ